MTSWPEPPTWFVRVCGAVVVVSAVVAFVGAVRIGVTVDETFHVMRLSNFLEHGWYLLDDDLGATGEPGAWVGDRYVYAPVTTLLLHGLNVVLGNETWSTVATSPAAYATRHLAVAVTGLVGVAATAATARLVSGSWRWGVVAAGVLSAMPMWWGHAMFNVKDVPVGTGYALVTLGCVAALLPAAAGRRRLLGPLLVAAGVLLTVGTRPAMWATLGASVGWAVLVLAWRGRSHHRPLRDAGVLALAGVAPLVALAGVYPPVFGHPLAWLPGSVSDSSSQEMVSSRAYLPFAIAATVPVVLLVVGLLGSYGRFAAWVRGRSGLLAGTTPLTVLLLVQALLMPVLLVAVSAAVSGGLRHVLFVAPAAAVLVAGGLATLLHDFGRRGRRVLLGVVTVGVLSPTVAQVQLFPYSYAYANELAGALDLAPAADFWQASFREYADDLPGDAFVVCGAAVGDEGRPTRRMPNGGQSWLVLGEDCRTPPLGVLAPWAGSGAGEAAEVVPGSFVSLRVRFDPASTGCRDLGDVTRRRLFDEVLLSTAQVCPLVLPDYAGPVVLDGAGRGADVLLDGWSGPAGAATVTARDRASLGFHLAAAVRPVLRVTGLADGDVEFLLNNRPAVARATATGWVVSAAQPLEELGEAGNVVLTFVADGGPVRVSGVEVVEDRG